MLLSDQFWLAEVDSLLCSGGPRNEPGTIRTVTKSTFCSEISRFVRRRVSFCALIYRGFFLSGLLDGQPGDAKLAEGVVGAGERKGGEKACSRAGGTTILKDPEHPISARNHPNTAQLTHLRVYIPSRYTAR